ncbi:unnamed protein product [Paramecium octaurelia]|uniref:Cyclic nucleotide-binding domain-containing protein n=1 Tax=Paramecium octaurelia TaxID=43137 RepID=A0A8S1WDH2_PAROT|nr:unnamed protein product [Paramecium octaurelia]
MSTQIPQLMMTEQPLDDQQDFLNYSLSEVYFSVSKFKDNRKNVSENSMNLNYKEQENSTPISPNNINQTKPSYLSSAQKSHSQDRISVNTTQEKVYRDFFQYFLIQKFVHKISFKKKLNSLFDRYHFEVINDLGASFDINLFRENTIKLTPIIVKQVRKIENQFSRRFKQITSQIQQRWVLFIKKIPLIYPESKLKLIWDGIVTAARFYFIFIIPLDLAWEMEQFMFDFLIIPTSLMLALLIIDYIISFNQAFYEFGSIVTDRRKIVQYVLTKSYGLDIVSILFLIIFLIISVFKNQTVSLTENWYQLLLLLFLIQYKNVSKLSEQVEEALNLSKQMSSLLELGKLFFLLFFVLHIFSCLWFWIGYYQLKNNHKTWLHLKNLDQMNWNEQYLYSFYFSTVTMFTVGYGDITPQSSLETVLCIMFMMICSIQLSYSVSTVGAIIDKISFYTKEKRKKVQAINTYMQNKKISYQLQFKIREYLNYYWSCNQQEETQEEKQIINQLSENLRENLQFEANSMILNNCPLFKNYFSEQLKKKLVKKIKSIVVQPENIIDFNHFFPEQKLNQCICFVEEGEIQIFIENEMLQNHVSYNSISIVNTVSKGSSLGLMSFITGVKARERFKSLGFSKLLLLSRDDFLKIIPEFPEDYEIFREMHDDLILNEDSQFLKLACFSCNSIAHKVIDCPLVHFIPDKEFIIKKYQFSRFQKRNESMKLKFRRNQKRQHGYFSVKHDLDLIQETAKLFQADNYKQCLFYEEIDDDSEKDKQKLHTPQFIRSINYTMADSIKEEFQLESSPKQQPFQQPQQSRRSIVQNMISKKSLSLLVDDFTLQPFKGIKKFKRVVEVVKSLNKIVNKKSSKAQTKNILASLSSENYRDLEQRSLLSGIKRRLKYIQNHNIECIDKDYQEMEFLRMKLQVLLSLQQGLEETQEKFETVRQFKFYGVHNNVDQILTVQNQFYKVKLQELDLPKIFQSFVKYLMYPYSFIHKYKLKADSFDVKEIKKEVVTKKEQNAKFSKLLTLHKQSKKLRNKLHIKKTQIQPL